MEAHIYDGFVFVVIQDSQKSLHRLYWAWEVEVEPKLDEDQGFEVNETLFTDILLFLIGKEVDHSGEAGRDWLL